jgi:hypothetical protein
MSENRIDQRMPPEFVTDSFLPSETSARSNGLKKLCCSSRKPVSNGWDKTGAVNQTWIYSVWHEFMEGLFYLIAIAILRHAWRAFFV